MARCLFSTLTTHLKNHLTGQFRNSVDKSLAFSVCQQNLAPNAFNYTCIAGRFLSTLSNPKNISTLIQPKSSPLTQPVRNVIKFSYIDGKRKTQHGVTDRFFRLRWGGWIRCKAGRHRKLWLKTSQRRRRLQEHVFCNYRQSKMLDTMVSRYWRRPKYYIEDPYEPYHSRDFPICRNKPWRPEGVDYE